MKNNASTPARLHYVLLWWNASAVPNWKCKQIYCGGGTCDECDGRCFGNENPPSAVGDYDNFYAHEHEYVEVTWADEYTSGIYNNSGIEWCRETEPDVIVSGRDTTGTIGW